MNDTCHICGESDNLVPVTIKDETIYLCPECKEAHLKQCSQCDDFFIDTENDYAVSRDGEIYCEFCRDEYLSYCEHCDEYMIFFRNSVTFFVSGRSASHI